MDLPWGGGGKEVGIEPLPVEELDNECEHAPLDLGSGHERGGGNQFESRTHQVDVAVGEELHPLDAPRLRALSGGDKRQKPVPVEELAKTKEVDDVEDRWVVRKTHCEDGVCQ